MPTSLQHHWCPSPAQDAGTRTHSGPRGSMGHTGSLPHTLGQGLRGHGGDLCYHLGQREQLGPGSNLLLSTLFRQHFRCSWSCSSQLHSQMNISPEHPRFIPCNAFSLPQSHYLHSPYQQALSALPGLWLCTGRPLLGRGMDTCSACTRRACPHLQGTWKQGKTAPTSPWGGWHQGLATLLRSGQ